MRRAISALLIILGAALLFLATEAWAGGILVVVGILIEAIAISIQRQEK
jgi:hypothetical protein